MRNAAYISSISWNSISGLDNWKDFRLGVSCAVTVMGRSCKYFLQVIYCNPIKGCLPSKVVFHQRSYFIKGCLPSQVVFRQRSSYIKGCPPSKVVIRLRSSSIEGHLSSKVVFHQRLSSVKGHLLSKVIFRQRSSSVKGRLPSNVFFRKRSSSVKGCLLSKFVKEFEPGLDTGWQKMLGQQNLGSKEIWAKKITKLFLSKRPSL